MKRDLTRKTVEILKAAPDPAIATCRDAARLDARQGGFRGV